VCTALAEHFKARGIQPKAWYFNTDGAPSHFKNRFTMHSLFKFKTTSGASTIVWETCAPGHGKGPWDGIGAVVKRLLRQLEKFEKVYCNGPRDVFVALVRHAAEHKQQLGSSVAISAIVYHYILLGLEPTLPHPNVWSAIHRPKVNPNVTRLTGIRDSFCFRVAGESVLALRELSCRCRCCLEHRWNDCKNPDAGAWRRVHMTCTAAAAVGKTRSQRAEISLARQRLAKLVQAGEMLALESAEDPEGFSFWLARAEGPAYVHRGGKETKAGRTFVPGGLYVPVRYYSRFPSTSSTTFKLTSEIQHENAEGLLARNVPVSSPSVRRSSRAQGSGNVAAAIVSISEEEELKLSDCISLDDV